MESRPELRLSGLATSMESMRGCTSIVLIWIALRQSSKTLKNAAKKNAPSDVAGMGQTDPPWANVRYRSPVVSRKLV